MTIRTSWPSAVRAFGRLPATSPRPPTLASGYASADANRIFIGISGWTCGLDLNLRPERRSPRSIPREIVRSIRPERSRRIFPSTAMPRPMPPTPRGHLLFVFHTHLPWVLGHGRWPHGEAWLHEATAECYLPLLRLLDRLEKEGRKGSITIGITPVLSEMLATARFREGFLAYLDERTNRAEADQREFDAAGDDGRRRAAAAWSDFYGGAKADFVERYNQDLLSAFTRLQNRDRIEIIVSAATHGYLPLLGRDESVNAQLATGIASYRRSFGRRPRGIWLPECACRRGCV